MLPKQAGAITVQQGSQNQHKLCSPLGGKTNVINAWDGLVKLTCKRIWGDFLEHSGI